jgi:hypothetical protein
MTFKIKQPKEKNIRYDEETQEYVVYCRIRGDYYEMFRNNNFLKCLRKRNEILETGGYEKFLKPHLKHHGSYVYPRDDKFIIVRQGRHYGTYENKNDARYFVRLLWKYDWDLDKIPLEYKERMYPRFHIKNYCYNKKTGDYIVTKKINGKVKRFGHYDTEEEAKMMVEELREVDWDINKLNFITRKKIMPDKPEPKYYIYNKEDGTYTVQKNIKGKNIYFGRYETEDEAKMIVEELKKVNWNKNRLSQNILNKMIPDKPEPKYYTYNKKDGVYIVQKTINGKNVNFGRYKTESGAKNKVKELKANNWII